MRILKILNFSLSPIQRLYWSDVCPCPAFVLVRVQYSTIYSNFRIHLISMRCFHRVSYSRYYLIGACISLSNFTKWNGPQNKQLLNSPYKIYDIIILQANFLFRNIFFKINYKKIIVESIISLSLSWICWKRYVKIKHQKRTEKKLRVYKSLFIFS